MLIHCRRCVLRFTRTSYRAVFLTQDMSSDSDVPCATSGCCSAVDSKSGGSYADFVFCSNRKCRGRPKIFDRRFPVLLMLVRLRVVAQVRLKPASITRESHRHPCHGLGFCLLEMYRQQPFLLPPSRSLARPRSRLSWLPQLGMHVRTVAMRSVLGSAPHAGGAGFAAGGAAGALRQEFQAAMEASPCVLHLRAITSLAGE